MSGAYIYGWDYENNCWRKIRVNDQGKLIIDPSELFEEPPTDGETGKGATSNWCHDHEADVAAHHAKYTDAEAVASFGNRLALMVDGTHTDFNATYINMIVFDTVYGDINLKGLKGGEEGHIIFCRRIDSNNTIKIFNNSPDAATTDKILTASNADEVISDGVLGGFQLIYTNNYWRVDYDIALCRKVIFEDTPTDNELLKGPTSNWAHDHKADAAAHHAKYTDAEAVDSFGNRYANITTGEYTDYDVSNINVIYLNTSGGNIDLKGLAGGSDGHMIFCIKTVMSNVVNIYYNSGDAADGDKIITTSNANETIAVGRREGFWMVYKDGFWRIDHEVT